MKRVLVCCAVLGLASCDQARPSLDAPAGSVEAAGETSGVPATPEVQAMADVGTPQRLTQQPQLLSGERMSEKPRQATIYTPPAGSPERVDLMNALRSQVRGELGGEAIFLVSELRSNGEWAFGNLDPQWRDGRTIDPRKTPLYQQNPGFPFDGLGIQAIWKKERGRWQVFAHAIGATDVWWGEYCDRVPHAVLGGVCTHGN